MTLLKKPLSEILRPDKLEDFIGQKHLTGENGPINLLIKNKDLNSMIFWGPPGVGKTTLARIISNELKVNFIEISPTVSGVSDIRKAVESAKVQFFGEKTMTIVFVDEIHRFNKAQQDYLLPHVENGTIVLIGATTENPSFEVVSPLLSRTRVYKFYPISADEMQFALQKALDYLKENNVDLKLPDETIELLVQIANGDVRTLYNSLDTLVRTGTQDLSVENVMKTVQNSPIRYDKKGDEHYDTISAFIKSMRASDVNAALYYLAKMVDAGEDPLFIARRMVIFSSEDIGMADSHALLIANSVFRACETIGYPECQLNLAHGVVYLAKAPKSRACNDAFFAAMKDVKNYGNLNIPLKIRNAPTQLMKDFGYGKDYEKYPEKDSYLPDKIKGKKYFK